MEGIPVQKNKEEESKLIGHLRRILGLLVTQPWIADKALSGLEGDTQTLIKGALRRLQKL